jgi:hypothetical protein
MAKRRSSRAKSGIPLPWEQRAAALRGVVAGARFRVALLVICLGLTAWVVFRAADHEMRTRQTRAAIDQVHRAIDAFRAEVGRCPESADELTSPPREGRRYLRDLPNDGWGKALYVACPAYDDPEGADVVSA